MSGIFCNFAVGIEYIHDKRKGCLYDSKKVKEMYTCSLHIVALPYYEVGECLGDFFAEADGRALTLRPEPTNDYDAQAIQAFDWQGRHVGYVASPDLLEA